MRYSPNQDWNTYHMYTDVDFVTMVRTIEHELMNDEEWRKPSEGREVISIEVQQSASVETRTQT